MQSFYHAISIPFGWIVSVFYTLSGNYLLSLFLMTLIIRLLLLPLAIKQQKSSAGQLRLQSKIARIKEQYKGDQRRINEETQAIYQREGFSSMYAGCLPLAIQMPILMGLYGVMYSPLTEVLNIATDIVDKMKAVLVTLPDYIAQTSASSTASSRATSMAEIYILKFFDQIVGSVPEAQTYADAVHTFYQKFRIFGIDLAETPNFKEFNILWLIPILAAVSSLLTSLFMFLKQRKTNPDQAKNPSAGCMILMSPLMSGYFAFILPCGVGVYWIMSNIISFVQTVVLSYTHDPRKLVAQLMIDETVERRSREDSIKKLRASTREEE